MKKISISVLIINYKTLDVLENAISSIDEPSIDIKFIILNNEPGKKLSLSINDKNITIFNSNINLGFASGMNYLISKSKEIFPEINYCFLMNPDSLSTSNLIFNLYKDILENEKCAIISPKILTLSRKNWYCGGVFNWENGTVSNSKESVNDTPIKIDCFNGCGALLDINKFYQTKGFFNDLFMYYDEAFLSMQFKNLGFEILYHSNLIMTHDVSYSTVGNKEFKVFHETRNGLAFFLLYSAGLRNKLRIIILYLFRGLKYVKHFNAKNIYSYYKGFLQSYILKRKLKLIINSL